MFYIFLNNIRMAQRSWRWWKYTIPSRNILNNWVTMEDFKNEYKWNRSSGLPGSRV